MSLHQKRGYVLLFVNLQCDICGNTLEGDTAMYIVSSVL